MLKLEHCCLEHQVAHWASAKSTQGEQQANLQQACSGRRAQRIVIFWLRLRLYCPGCMCVLMSQVACCGRSGRASAGSKRCPVQQLGLGSNNTNDPKSTNWTNTAAGTLQQKKRKQNSLAGMDAVASQLCLRTRESHGFGPECICAIVKFVKQPAQLRMLCNCSCLSSCHAVFSGFIAVCNSTTLANNQLARYTLPFIMQASSLQAQPFVSIGVQL